MLSLHAYCKSVMGSITELCVSTRVGTMFSCCLRFSLQPTLVMPCLLAQLVANTEISRDTWHVWRCVLIRKSVLEQPTEANI